MQIKITRIEIIIALRIIPGDIGLCCWGGLSCRSFLCRNMVFRGGGWSWNYRDCSWNDVIRVFEANRLTPEYPGRGYDPAFRLFSCGSAGRRAIKRCRWTAWFPNFLKNFGKDLALFGSMSYYNVSTLAKWVLTRSGRSDSSAVIRQGILRFGILITRYTGAGFMTQKLDIGRATDRDFYRKKDKIC